MVRFNQDLVQMGLEIRLLGIPEIICDGNNYKIKTSKVLYLLAYLLFEKRPITKDNLIYLLWPNSDEIHGRKSLRNAISHLRKVFRPYARQCILTENNTIRLVLNPEIFVDINKIEAISEGTNELRYPNDNNEIDRIVNEIQILQDSTSLYRDEFLTGFSFGESPEFEEWVTFVREHYHRLYENILNRLFYLEFSIGQNKSALETAKLWIDLNPFSDSACRSLMIAYNSIQAGEDSIRVYKEFKDRLASELGCNPEPKTEDLFQKIHQEISRSELKIPFLKKVTCNSLAFPFVGRTIEINSLISAFYETTKPGNRIVVVIGEAGIGKTRFVNEFLQWVKYQNVYTITGSSWEGSFRVPYQPIVESIRSFIETDEASKVVPKVDDVWLVELTRLLPELRSKYRNLPDFSTDETTSKQALFESVSHFMSSVATEKPIIWLLEDLHWADMASIDLLNYSLRSWTRHNSPILFITTIREEMINSVINLRNWIDELGRDIDITTIQLNPLDFEDIKSYLNKMDTPLMLKNLSAEDKDKLCSWLWEQTNGFPLLLAETSNQYFINKKNIEEILHPSFAQIPNFHEENFQRINLEINPRINEIVHWRMNRLSQNALNIAQVGAIVGSHITFDIIARVTNLSEEEIYSAIDELLLNRIFQLTDKPGSNETLTFRFTHVIIKDIVQSSIPNTKKFVLHRKIFNALQETGSTSASLAYHARMSNQYESAFVNYAIAGNNALELFDPKDAIYYFEKARQLLDEQIGPTKLSSIIPLEKIENLYIKLSLAYEILFDWSDAKKIYHALLTIAEETRQKTLEWTALNRLSILTAQNDFEINEAKKYLIKAITIAEEINNQEMIAESEWNLMQMETFSWDPISAITRGKRAYSISRELNIQELTARVLFALGDAYSFAGEWDESIKCMQESLSLYQNLNQNFKPSYRFPAQYVWAGLPPSEAMNVKAMQASCMSQLAEGYMHVGNLIKGVRLGQDALDLGVGLKNDWTQSMSLLILGTGLINIGQYENGFLMSKQAVLLAQKIKNPALLLFSKSAYGFACNVLGLYEIAQEELLCALDMVEKLPSINFQAYAVSLLCMNAVKQGKWEEAYRYALLSIANRKNTPAQLIVLDHHRNYEILALLHKGKIDSAIEEINSFSKQVGHNVRYQISYYQCRATLEYKLKNYQVAAETLIKTIDLAKKIGLISEVWQLYQILGKVYSSSGEVKKAKLAFSNYRHWLEKLTLLINDKTLKDTFLRSIIN